MVHGTRACPGSTIAAMPEDRSIPALAIVVSRYNRSITEALERGAIEAYTARGGRRDDLAVIDAPGAFELPVIAQGVAESGMVRGVVALGCVIKGETSHDRHINAAVSQGLMHVATSTGVPVGFGVLTCDNADQARARAGGDKGNKGADAIYAVLDAIAALDAVSDAAGSGDLASIPRASAPTHDKAGQG